jgi:hypothetical protein
MSRISIFWERIKGSPQCLHEQKIHYYLKIKIPKYIKKKKELSHIINQDLSLLLRKWLKYRAIFVLDLIISKNGTCLRANNSLI